MAPTCLNGTLMHDGNNVASKKIHSFDLPTSYEETCEADICHKRVSKELVV